MALDKATIDLLADMAENGGKPLHEMTPDEARSQTAGLKEMYGPGPEMSQVRETHTSAEDGFSVPIRVLVPHDQPRGLILYFHGGGWVIGAIDEFDTLGRRLAQRTGCAVALVDYRLAPEHRYPTAVRDAWASVQWADEHLEQLAGSRLPLIVSGDSSGGNLAAVVAHRAHEQGGPDISLQVLVYPVTDHDMTTSSYTDPENQLMLERDTMAMFWDHYVPDVAARNNPDASPLRAGNFSGLPPAVVLTAEHDVLRDEGEAYAERLRDAGVAVEQQRFDGQMHGFFTMVNLLPGSAAGIDYVVTRIDKHLAAAG
ncbi:alpha/beta hydrolase [Haloactinomyces albus]|uniref:Acetyl esterase n=1 Tax=Haloactinomyces albus TaxID=1352928 RepID=A0AAE3ZI12_9ACTN|nr:alpha/beta hydrolase [Haloactinomyces albus]MDR7303968.1 acetyl esterase [Haloactinomyces albus]